MEALTDIPIITVTEREAYVARLEQLRTVRDQDLAALLRDARGFVSSDAAEEIVQIREDHVVVEQRIKALEQLLSVARVVEDDAPADTVSVGRTVEVEYLPDGGRRAFRIAGSSLTNAANTISAASPMGAAMLGRTVGDLVSVLLPNGITRDLRIVTVTA